MNFIGLTTYLDSLSRKLGAEMFQHGDVHTTMLAPDIKYPVVNAEYLNVTVLPTNLVRYNIRLTWADRETADEGNRLDNWSNSIRFFSKVQQSLQETYEYKDDVIDITPELRPQLFYQRFTDLTSGSYCDVEITVRDEQCD